VISIDAFNCTHGAAVSNRTAASATPLPPPQHLVGRRIRSTRRAGDALRCGLMQSNADQPPVNQPVERRLTVHEAAKVLGITPEAVRGRIQRGTLLKEKAEDGTVYVRLTADQMRSTADEPSDESLPDSALVAQLKERIEHLTQIIATRDEEIRRRDTILITMAQRIPELEPASEPRDGRPETPAEADPGTQAPPESPKGIWRRLFGR
jgi:hypothetical protein